ncbi:MAG: bacterial Ig-like domain-containing protein [Erysipelotrichales bacterium]|nr:bacterial Ig-like domain-containing protein [Erysipelotrichales bacterium]
MIPWNEETKLILLIIVAAILLIAVFAFIIELVRGRNAHAGNVNIYVRQISEKDVPKEEPKEEVKQVQERVLLGLSVNTDNIKKEYTAGDEFCADGLVVTAHYNLDPVTEEVKNFEIEPVNMNQVGMPIVTVKYADKSVGFQITINPVVVEEQPEVIHVKKDPVVVTEESYESGKLRYDRSFTARYIQSDDEIKLWYTEIKNNLLSYKKVKARMSWKRESFRYGREQFAKLSYRGNTLCLFLPLNAADFEDTKYKVEDVSDNNNYAETPCMYRIKNARRAKYALELIAIASEKYDIPLVAHEAEDFYVPYEGLVELINKGLIKRNIKSKEDEAFFNGNNVEEVEEQPSEKEVAPGLIVKTETKKGKSKNLVTTK